MKILNLGAFLAAALLLASGCATTRPDTPSTNGDSRAITEDVELVVFGLSCPLCASNLDRHVANVPGVERSWIDLSTGHVQVSLEPGAEVASSDLRRAVRDAGFTLQSIRPREAQP